MPVSRDTCPVGQFRCTDGRCIFARYQCDRFRDCLDGSDETVDLCGEDPCRDRIKCGTNGRCIPASWCCHRPQHVQAAPYDCDIWERQICCSQSIVWNTKSEYGGNFGAAVDISDHSTRIGFGDPETLVSASAPKGRDSVWGLQSAVFIVAGCALAFVGLMLFASFIGARYLVRKLHHEQASSAGVVRDRCNHSYRRGVSESNDHCRHVSQTEHRHVSAETTGNQIPDSSRSSIDAGDLPRVYYLRGCHRCHHNNCRHDDPSCSVLLYSPQQVGTVSDVASESPPPPYVAVDSMGPPPAYYGLPHDPVLDDGLPGYSSALRLLGGNSVEAN